MKLSEISVPYEQIPAVSGLRVFGTGNGKKADAARFTISRNNEIDMQVEIDDVDNALGYNIIWGHTPDKLYHSLMTFTNSQRIGALVSGEEYYVRVDAFNENGITKGKVKKLS